MADEITLEKPSSAKVCECVVVNNKTKSADFAPLLKSDIFIESTRDFKTST